MADHARTQIRDHGVGLIDALATTSTRAYAGRPKSHPVQESELPLWLVYTDEEESGHIAGTRPQRRKQRFCQLKLHGYASSSGDVDKTMDTMAKEAEAAIEADPTFNGLAKDVYLVGTEKRSDPDVSKPTFEIVLTYTVEYHTREGVPDAALA